MNKYLSFLANRHQDILKYLLILSAALVIANFFPKVGIFKYEFETGKPWKYENLIAPFDFGIQKPAEEVESEINAILEEFSPFYRINHDVLTQNREQFIGAFNEKLRFTKSATLNIISIDSASGIRLGLDILGELYQHGIINLIEDHKSFPPDKRIKVLKSNNVADIRTVDEMYTLKKAYQYNRDAIQENGQVPSGFLLPLMENAVAYNVFYDDATTQKRLDTLLAQISLTRGMVQEEEEIIRKGAIITEEKNLVLNSYKKEFEERVLGSKQNQLILLGNVILTMIIIVIFSFFIKIFSPKVFMSNRKLLLVFFLITALTILVSQIVERDLPILYAIPFCIVPIILRTFFGAHLALHAHIVLVLLTSFIVPYGIEFTFIQFTAGMVAIFTTVRAYYWSQFFISTGYILLTYLLGYFAISITQEGSLQNVDLGNFGWLTLNVLLTLLAYPLIPIFEKLFGFISEITLLELSDINKPILKDLSIKAPGTFHHSLQVANLAEAAAYEIGANTLLVKVGALYHDIGKIEDPLYFIENQNTQVNPHDDLTFEESAKIIIGHVRKGVSLAKKMALPDVLIDFIRTHHGTTRVEYFYQSHLKNFPEKDVEEAKFSYPGPKPYSKETAIVMMSDCVEAASRSLKDPSDKDIEELVETLINRRIEEEQFTNSDITFKEITVTKKVLKKMLNSIYHVRIAYPDSQETKKEA